MRRAPAVESALFKRSMRLFDLPLLNSLVPVWSAGDATPTYTGATAKHQTDHEGKLNLCLSGEARFQGARRVRNLVTGSSNDWTNAYYTKANGGTGVVPVVTANYAVAPDGTTTASRVVFDRGAGTTGSDTSRIYENGGAAYTDVRRTTWMKSNTASSYSLRWGTSAGVFTVVITPTWQRFATSVQTGYPDMFLIGNVGADSVADISVWGEMNEVVTGQSNQNPSETISVGVLSAPYHGANVDGVKYFATLNGNTVASNVVTEATGAAINSGQAACAGGVTAGVVLPTRPAGYLPEGARTNLCLQSQDISTTWTNFRSTETVNSHVAPDGTTTADSMLEDATAASTHGIKQAITFAAATHSWSIWLKGINRTWAQLQISDGTNIRSAYFQLSGAGAVGALGPSSTASIEAWPNGWYRCTVTGTTVAAADGLYLFSAEADNDITFDGNTSNGLVVWGAQVEAASFASTYIPTTTVAVTRNRDALNYVFEGNANTAMGTVYAEAYSTGLTPGDAIVSFGNSSGALFCNASTSISTDDATNSASKTGLTSIITAVRKRAASWGGSGLLVTGDGATPGSGTFDGAVSATNISIGSTPAGTNPWFGSIANVRIYGTQANAAQLQAMTA